MTASLSKYLLLFTIAFLSTLSLYSQKYAKAFEEAQEAFAEGKNQKALELLEKSLDIHPHNVEARLLRIIINQKTESDVAVCADINVLREYGCKESDTIFSPDCPDFISPKTPENTDQSALPESNLTIEEMPMYPGGDANLMKDLSSQIRYPTDCLENNIAGKIFMQFVVEKDGTISNISVTRSIENGRSLEMEAYKAIIHLKKFKPATQLGKPVRTIMNLPVVFNLK